MFAMEGRRLVHSLALLLVLGVAKLQEGRGEIFHPERCATICSQEEYETPLPVAPSLLDGNRAYQWSIVLLNQIKENLPSLSPPGVGRMLGIFGSCLHDAAAMYTAEMKPAFANTIEEYEEGSSVELAIDGAAYQALSSMFEGRPSFDKVYDFLLKASGEDVVFLQFKNDFLVRLNGIKGNEDFKAFTIGKLACADVIEEIQKDGFDVLANPIDDSLVDYAPVNKPQREAGITDCSDEMASLDHWQPLCVPLEFGSEECKVQEFLGPAAGKMSTFGRLSISAILPKEGPPLLEQNQEFEYLQMAEQVVNFSANLNDVNKLVAEHWADGPDTTFPPGHFFRIGMEAAKKEGLDLFETAKILFLVGNAMNDAGVAAWHSKVAFDSVRPLQMIQCGMGGKQVSSWIGPYLGVGTIDASTWQPYQATTFVTPPFAGFVSGHSTFSAAGAAVLKSYFSDDENRAPKCHRYVEGNSLFEGKKLQGEHGFEPGLTDVPNQGPATRGYCPREDVTLCWETFSGAAEDAGISRLHGGIHIIADHTQGVLLGQEVAQHVFDRAQGLWS